MLSNLETIDEIKCWMLSLFKRLTESDSSDAIQYNSEYVRKAIGFIKKNYTKNIPLSDVANEINIGSTYLSKLFKDEVGVGFSEYLGNLRIEKAKTFT